MKGARNVRSRSCHGNGSDSYIPGHRIAGLVSMSRLRKSAHSGWMLQIVRLEERVDSREWFILPRFQLQLWRSGLREMRRPLLISALQSGRLCGLLIDPEDRRISSVPLRQAREDTVYGMYNCRTAFIIMIVPPHSTICDVTL